MPKVKREALAAIISAEMLTQGVYFDSQSIYALPVDDSLVARTFRALLDARVIARSTSRAKYLFTDSFLEEMRRQIASGMPRGIFVHYPDLTVFDMCGIKEWTESELQTYVRRLKERWALRTGIP
ncbi:MAG: hypothetical protein HY247_08210 [archaeon]|nr:MAG: hypothetical protein HY247_08210 [archaeon]